MLRLRYSRHKMSAHMLGQVRPSSVGQIRLGDGVGLGVGRGVGRTELGGGGGSRGGGVPTTVDCPPKRSPLGFAQLGLCIIFFWGGGVPGNLETPLATPLVGVLGCWSGGPGWGWTCPPQVGGHAPGTEQCFAYDSLHVCVCVCMFGGWVRVCVHVFVWCVCLCVRCFLFTYWWGYCKVLSALKTSAIVNIV